MDDNKNNEVINNNVDNTNNYDINNKFNNGFSTTNTDLNNYPQQSADLELKKDIKFLKAIILILFVIIAGIIAWVVIKDNTKSKTNDGESLEEKNNIKIEKTETTKNNAEGVYLLDVSDVVDKAMPSIVAITSKTLVSSGYYGPFYSGKEQYQTGAGSGIIIDKNDNELLILTNRHVIEDADQLTVKFIDDKSVDATVKGASNSKDVAVISVKIKDIDSSTLKQIKIATIGSSKNLKVGQGVVAIGNALGYGQSVTTGVISALNRQVKVENSTTNMIQTDAAINGGNSGGALLNSNGELIGINSAKYSSSGYSSQASIEGMGFAIPISDVTDIIEKLKKGETVTEKERGYLGISGYVTSNIGDSSIPTGVYIKSIVKNSGADKAGLSIGNIITKINDTEIVEFEDITKVLEDKKAGDKVTVYIKYASGREYKEKKVTVKLSSYKEVN